MSLVSEALKKAEREAAARQARAQGMPEPPPLQPFRTRPRRRRALALGIALGAFAALAIMGLLSSRPWRETPSAVAPSGAGVAPLAPSVSPGPPAPEAGGAPLDSARADQPSAPAPPNVSRTESHSPVERAPAPAPGASRRPAPAPEAPPAEPVEAATTPTTPATAETAQETARPPANDFVRRAELPDGTVLVLGGIAYSESAPLAYLNGKLLAVGESIAGYRIERIARDRVELASDGRRITVRLKSP